MRIGPSDRRLRLRCRIQLSSDEFLSDSIYTTYSDGKGTVIGTKSHETWYLEVRQIENRKKLLFLRRISMKIECEASRVSDRLINNRV